MLVKMETYFDGEYWCARGKWMFIMEDIVYWNYLGREKLYTYLKEL